MGFQIKKLGKLFDMGSLGSLEGGVIGIDIGTSSLKVIQLNIGKSGATLETYGELQLGPYMGADVGKVVNLEPSKLALALVDIIREANVTARSCALAIPHSACFVAVAHFPTRDQTQLVSMVPVEARKYVPMAMNEVTLDWFIIPDPPRIEGAPEPTETRVLLAAIYNESLNRYRGVVQNAGIAVGSNEIETFSVVRSSIHESDGSILLLDLGASSTKLYIVESGILQETHRIPLGGQELTSAVGTALNLGYGEAESIKRQMGLLSDTYDPRIGAALAPIVDRIFTETNRALTRYERDMQIKINTIVLTGGGALLVGLLERAQATFAREVTIANPFSKVEYPAFLEETLREAGPSFSVAMGVALRRLTEK